MTFDNTATVNIALYTTDHTEFLAKLGGTERYRLWRWGEVSHDIDDDGNGVIIYEMEEGNFIKWLGELSPAACEAFQCVTFVWDEDDDDDDDDGGQLPELMEIGLEGDRVVYESFRLTG
jgi:hypothetical protein